MRDSCVGCPGVLLTAKELADGLCSDCAKEVATHFIYAELTPEGEERLVRKVVEALKRAGLA